MIFVRILHYVKMRNSAAAHPLWLIFRLAQEFAHMTKSHYNMGSKAGEGALGASTDFVSLLTKLKVVVGESET